MKAAQIQEQGELEVIKVIEIPTPVAARGEVVYRVAYAGVNFIDTYQRAGVYKVPLPFTIGNESAGIVTEIGEGVTKFKVGSRLIAYTPGGSFAEYCKSAVTKAAIVPETISLKDAATGLLQGLTALAMSEEAHEVKKGQFVLIHAAAGGLGSLLVQVCKAKGAIVIGTTSTEAKAAIAKANGADHVILSSLSEEEIIHRVFEITGGEGIDRGVHVSFDSIGKDTVELSLAVVRRKGTFVTCGNASGPCPPIAPLRLGPKNMKLVRPVLNQYVHTAEEFDYYTSSLFALIESGDLKLTRWNEEGYELSTEGIRATQEDIMSRKTNGKLIVKVATELK